MLADLGCGSGLGAPALQRQAGAAWIGLDITPQMLDIAASTRSCAGHFVVSDMGQGLPLRASCLDGAISISAVQARLGRGGADVL